MASNLPAGDFSTWLGEIQRAVRGGSESAVPCGGCTACCRSSQFVHIAPDEADTLAHIPQQLLFPAPGLPAGHLLLGYDARGHCPMLVDNACSVYEHRPRTCRTYDCRVFPAAGVDVDDPDQAAVADQAGRWLFSYRTAMDRTEHDAVRAAARFLADHPELPAGGPLNATATAVLAVQVHRAFLQQDAAGTTVVVADPGPDAVRAEMSHAVSSTT